MHLELLDELGADLEPDETLQAALCLIWFLVYLGGTVQVYEHY